MREYLLDVLLLFIFLSFFGFCVEMPRAGSKWGRNGWQILPDTPTVTSGPILGEFVFEGQKTIKSLKRRQARNRSFCIWRLENKIIAVVWILNIHWWEFPLKVFANQTPPPFNPQHNVITNFRIQSNLESQSLIFAIGTHPVLPTVAVVWIPLPPHHRWIW